jgi:hypothetical protein
MVSVPFPPRLMLFAVTITEYQRLCFIKRFISLTVLQAESPTYDASSG